ncbi:MAG: ABC transporter permease [Phycisphaerales bacterium]|nr:ABC transporter permease [Phycisphaerales bacterium]
MEGERISPAYIFRRFAPALSLVLAAAFFWAIAPDRPLSVMDARTILLQTVIVATVALGMTIVMVSGGIDLSVGSAVALCGVAAAKVMKPDWDPGLIGWQTALAVLIAMATGALCGLYNGLLVTMLRLPPFIVTLGTLGFFRGVAKWVSGNSPVYSKPGRLESWVAFMPRPAWLIVAPAVWIMLGLALIAGLFLHRTVPGRWAVATGSSEEAARRAGLPINRIKIMVYTIGGVLVGLAGALQFARLGGSGDPTVQVGLELKAVAAVVIGGASLSGGHASIVGTLCGALLMALLDNRCTALGWPNFVQEMVVGHIIIIAVAVDRWRARAGRRVIE